MKGYSQVWVNLEQWRKDENTNMIYKSLFRLNLSREISNYPPFTYSIRYIPIPIFRGNQDGRNFESPSPTFDSVSASKFGP